ncbi:TfoX/Sxy family protein [Leeia oryzae]|uniref:TfoX/Sxy family protein n=1 Tax=Leeia oryzae TaxID=356662 RepID=UPI00036A3790
MALQGHFLWEQREPILYSNRKISNLGPKSLAMLEKAGIGSIAQVIELGSVRTFLRVRQVCPEASLNLLWALEGALSNTPWQMVARMERTRLLLELDDQCKAASKHD